MLNLKYESVIDFSYWSKQLFKNCVIAAILASGLELAILIRKMLTGELVVLGEYAFVNIISPSLFHFGILVIMNTFLKNYNKREDSGKQALICIASVTLMCASLVVFHYTVSSIYLLFCLPILISLIYLDKKPIIYAFVLNILIYLTLVIFIIPMFPNYDEVPHGSTEIFTVLIILIIEFLIVSLIFNLASKVIDDNILKGKAIKRDGFTKLYNHAAFYDTLGKWISEYNKSSTTFSLITWDIDDFKNINDQYGHNVGDTVLLQFADILKSHTNCDEPSFRYGGEEFVLLTRKKEKEAYELSCRIRKAFSKTCCDILVKNKETVTASAGISTYDPKLFQNRKDFFESSDIAMYVAKSHPGKNKSIVWSKTMSY